MTDVGVVIAWLGARVWTVVAVACLVAGIAIGRWSNRPDAVQQAQLDSLDVASARRDTATAVTIVRSALTIDSLQRALLAANARDSVQRAALRQRVVPTPVLAAAPVPDTCRAGVVPLIEQLAIRDSVHELDSAQVVRLESAVRTWDRVAAGLAVAAIEEQQLRHRAEDVAKKAVRANRPPRLELEVEPAVQAPDLRLSARAGATVGLGQGWQATGSYVGVLGEAGTWQIGLRKTLRIL